MLLGIRRRRFSRDYKVPISFISGDKAFEFKGWLSYACASSRGRSPRSIATAVAGQPDLLNPAGDLLTARDMPGSGVPGPCFNLFLLSVCFHDY